MAQFLSVDATLSESIDECLGRKAGAPVWAQSLSPLDSHRAASDSVLSPGGRNSPCRRTILRLLPESFCSGVVARQVLLFSPHIMNSKEGRVTEVNE